jgi:MYXO-CTERM domain-containing protein
MLLIGGVALLCVGAFYAGYALYAACLPLVGEAYAALIAAGVLFFAPLFVLMFLAAINRRRRRAVRDLPPNSPENVVLSLLAGIAKDRPIMSVAAAALVGIAAAFLRRRKK